MSDGIATQMGFFRPPAAAGGPFDPEADVSSAGIVFWYEAASANCLKSGGGACADGDECLTWSDLSSNGNNATTSAGFGATFTADGGSGWNNDPVLLTKAANGGSAYNLVDLSSLTAGHLFTLVEAPSDPGNAVYTWSRFGTHSFSAAYPYSNGVIYDGFGSTVRKTVGNPTPSLASARLYETISTSSKWQALLDGSSLYSTGTNTVGFSSTPRLFRDFPSTGTIGAKIRAMILYDGELSSGEAASVRTYLSGLI